MILETINLIAKKLKNIRKINSKMEISRMVHELKRSLISTFIMDVAKESHSRIHKYRISSHLDILNSKDPIVFLSEEMIIEMNNIRNFLRNNMYQNKEILDHLGYAEDVVKGLFSFYKENLNKLPLKYNIRNYPSLKINRIICDFIAGMTDNYAIEKYKELVL